MNNDIRFVAPPPETRTVPAAELRRIALLLYGERCWAKPFAEALGTTQWQVLRWCSEKSPDQGLPASLKDRLAEVVFDRLCRIRDVHDALMREE